MSELCELVTLCHINRSVPVLFETVHIHCVQKKTANFLLFTYLLEKVTDLNENLRHIAN